MATQTPFGPAGEAVYKRTYSRLITEGELSGQYETWPDTVQRVAQGNLELVYGKPHEWADEVIHEYNLLTKYMNDFKIIPAGRQLWATGVPGRQFLFNCHVSGWGKNFSDHFAFTFMRLVEGGGVGANYSSRLIEHYGAPRHPLHLVLTADGNHPDYAKMEDYLVDPDEFDIDDPDYVQDTREGWAAAIEELIDEAMSVYHGAEGRPVAIQFDLSKIRPEGSPLVSSGGVAAGPAPLAKMLTDVAGLLNEAHEAGYFTPVKIMEIDHAISVGAVAGGKRRSARMSICHWKDPHVFDFIGCKRDGSKHWSTNISVEIDQEFLNHLDNLDGHSPDSAWAKQVHLETCKAMLENGEPGYWNSEYSQEGEPGRIIATNPCGEIPLEAWEACNLGSVNLDAFVREGDTDWEGLEEAHRLLTRFLIRSTFADISDPKQREVQDRNRRIGVGHIGVQGFWAKRGVKYSDIPSQGKWLLKDLYGVVRDTARDYAFQLRIPEPVKVTTVQPAGTISKMPGVSEGIHPIYAKWYERRIRFSLRDEREFSQVADYMSQGFKVEQDVYDESGMTQVVVFPTEDVLVHQVRALGLDTSVVQSAEDLSIRDMLCVQALYQEYWADNAVSYTVNIPQGSVSPDELSEILIEYLPRLKGTTIMVDATRQQMPYTRISEGDYAVASAKRVEDSTDEACATGACPVK